MSHSGTAALFLLGSLHLLPVLITFLLSFDMSLVRKNRPLLRAICIASGCISFIGNFAAYVLLHKYLIGRWNFFYTLQAVRNLQVTYQELEPFSYLLLLCYLFAFLFGVLARFLLPHILDAPLKRGNVSRRKKAALISMATVALSAVAILFSESSTGTYHIVINEIGSYNLTAATDENGTVCDYIELYNRGQLPCRLSGLYLSDDPFSLSKKAVPSITLPANGHLLIKLDDGIFSLRSSGGETVSLSDSLGRLLDYVITQAVDPDIAFSRSIDGSASWELVSATPGTSNSNGTIKLKSAPSFSHASGYYSNPFSLQISADEGCTIYYSLDGSIPTTDSLVYSGSIDVYDRSAEPNRYRSIQNTVLDWKTNTPYTTPVDKAFIVRAVAVSESGAVSDISTATYIIGLDEYKDQNVVSLVVDPADFWGDNGIYVTGKAYDDWYLSGAQGAAPYPNFLQRGRAYEVDAEFAFLSPDLSFDQSVGVRINGASGRYSPMKRLSLYAREEYSGNRFFNEAVIPGTASRKLLLRTGNGHAIYQLIVQDRNVAIQRSVPASVFLNGEHWYHCSLMEKYDASYFQEHYGIDEQNIIVCEDYTVGEGMPEDLALWTEVFTFLVSNDMTQMANYEAFGELVDLQSYIDFMCINIYFDNLDYTEQKNMVTWRARTPSLGEYADGKWRFAMYDLDAVDWNDASLWGLKTQAEKNSFSLIPRFTGGISINQQQIYAYLKQNSLYRQQFVLTFMDLVNSVFAYDHVQQVISDYRPLGSTVYYMDEDPTGATNYYLDFFRNRATYIVPYMAEEFGLTGTLETLTLSTNDSSGGEIRLNTITPDLTDGDWQGQYYTDYSVTVTAVPNPGYEFVGWEGCIQSSEPTLEIHLEEGGTALHAIFQKIGS